jgi:hypothetical protein
LTSLRPSGRMRASLGVLARPRKIIDEHDAMIAGVSDR